MIAATSTIVDTQAVLYRMVMDKHICPWGLKARHLLRSEGYEVDDRWLTTREQTDAFKKEHGVAATPQVFIGGERIGGYDDLRRFLHKPVRDPEALTYAPVIALFAMAALIAMAGSWASLGTIFSMRTVEWFVALAMCLLAIQKLRDVDGFATMFLGYDLLARRWVPYASLYPFLEGLAGLLMLAGVLLWLAIPMALFIGTVGAVSVYYAVYVQRRELECACVGEGTNVPLGFVSLTENLMMVAMAGWKLIQHMG
ncbi:MAG: glutaredoxin [Betaproteobacteria bacterium]